MRLILSFTTNLGCGNGPSPAALALYFTHFDLLKHLDRVTPHQLSSHTGAAAHFSKEIRCSALCCRPCAAGLQLLEHRVVRLLRGADTPFHIGHLAAQLVDWHRKIRLRWHQSKHWPGSAPGQHRRPCSIVAGGSRLQITSRAAFCFLLHLFNVSTEHAGPRDLANFLSVFRSRSPSYDSPSVSGGLKYLQCGGCASQDCASR